MIIYNLTINKKRKENASITKYIKNKKNLENFKI